MFETNYFIFSSFMVCLGLAVIALPGLLLSMIIFNGYLFKRFSLMLLCSAGMCVTLFDAKIIFYHLYRIF